MKQRELASTGVAGLDDILAGGLTRERIYLIEGTPGTGKTTLGMGFLLAGAKTGEGGLYITLAETKIELQAVAESHGWSIHAIELVEMVPADGLGEDQEQTLLHPSEVELGETVRDIMAKVDATKPARIVIDSLSELRLLAQTPVRYRRQILALKHFFASRKCTVLLLNDKSASGSDLQLQSIAHGVIMLEQTLSGFGAQRRRTHVVTMRGVRFRGGYHDFEIEQGGLCVYPRLVAAEHGDSFDDAPVSTRSSQLDELLGVEVRLALRCLLPRCPERWPLELTGMPQPRRTRSGGRRESRLRSTALSGSCGGQGATRMCHHPEQLGRRHLALRADRR